MTTAPPSIGIDLGTTFSVVAYLDTNGHPQTLSNSDGDLTTPSVVLLEDGEPVVVLPCGHFHHSDCIERWWKQEKNTCPTCRNMLPTNDPDFNARHSIPPLAQVLARAREHGAMFRRRSTRKRDGGDVAPTCKRPRNNTPPPTNDARRSPPPNDDAPPPPQAR